MRHDATTVPTGLSLLKRAPPLLALLALASVTFADEGTTGPNGGQIKDAGKHHLELVVKENALTVYVTDAKHQKIITKGASGTATVLAGKNNANVKLEPSSENALAGSGKFESTRHESRRVVDACRPESDPGALHATGKNQSGQVGRFRFYKEHCTDKADTKMFGQVIVVKIDPAK